MSRPIWGAWIEILFYLHIIIKRIVAPHMGRVD